MAESIAVEGQTYLKRDPLGVLLLSFITFGIYFIIWYYKINKELKAFEHDDTISPGRCLMAMIFGWILIVPPFIAMYNTAKHVRGVEDRRGIQPVLEPAFVIVFMLLVSVGNGVYIQEHLNRIWDRAASAGALPPPAVPPIPPTPPLPSG